MDPDTMALARHIDRIRRIVVPCRAHLAVREFRGGWLSARPGGAPEEFASASPNRVYWLTRDEPPGEADIRAAREAVKSLDVRRAFIWLAPWAWTPTVDRGLLAHGAMAVPDVEYLVLLRGTAAAAPAAECAFDVRRVDRQDAAGVLDRAAAWYGADGAAAVLRGTARADLEVFAAFDGPLAVASAVLIRDGAWAYLGWAGTDAAYRCRGAQTGLIAARVRRARQLGARWCTCETVTADAASLRNLRRAGFRDALAWRVYRWELGGGAGTTPESVSGSSA